MTKHIEKAWTDLFNSSIEPRRSLARDICVAMLAGLGAGLAAGLFFFLN